MKLTAACSGRIRRGLVLVMAVAVLPLGLVAQVRSLSGASVDFGTLAMGATGKPVAVEFQIAAGTVVAGIQLRSKATRGNDFVAPVEGTCTVKTYAQATVCAVPVRFSPAAVGYRSGAVVFSDGSGNALATVYLYGVSEGAQPVYYSQPKVTALTGYPATLGLVMDAAANEFYVNGQDVYGTGRPMAVTPTYETGVQANPVAVDKKGNVYVGAGNEVDLLPWTGTAYGATVVVAAGNFNPIVGVVVDPDLNVLFESWSCGCVLEARWNGKSYAAPVVVMSGLGFSSGKGLTMDSMHNLYAADTNNGVIQRSLWQGGRYAASTAVAGLRYYQPTMVSVDDSGNLTTYDARNGFGELVLGSMPSLVFAKTVVGHTAANSGQVVEIENHGTAALTLTEVTYPVDFPRSAGIGGNGCVAGTVLQPGARCVVSVDFEPTVVASILKESVVLTGSSANVHGVVAKVPLVGYSTGK